MLRMAEHLHEVHGALCLAEMQIVRFALAYAMLSADASKSRKHVNGATEWNLQVALVPRCTVYMGSKKNIRESKTHFFPQPLTCNVLQRLGASLIKPCLVVKPPVHIFQPPLKYGNYGGSTDPFPQPALATKSLPFALETHSKIQGSSKSNTWFFAAKNEIKWLSGV